MGFPGGESFDPHPVGQPVDPDQRHDDAPDVGLFLKDHPDTSLSEKLARVLAEQYSQLQAGEILGADHYLQVLGELGQEPAIRSAIETAELDSERAFGHTPSIMTQADLTRVVMEEKPSPLADTEPITSNAAENPQPTGPPLETTEDADSPAFRSQEPLHSPAFIGRYRVTGILGTGGFGRVFLAQDDILHRPVAIKVPHPYRVSKPEDVETYLDEARVLASLDHPNIVPVYDVGRAKSGLCFVVSKVIEGKSLSAEVKLLAGQFPRIAEMIAEIAEALHHAHAKGLTHRDVKPSNILLDSAGHAFLVDFGLALREEEVGKGSPNAGTPAYMSPEQARGEGHRIDGRTDLFSLGVVFYELLTGQHPFGFGRREVIMERIAMLEPRSPRQIDEAIPKELERICLRAMARRITDRYATAKELSDDLRYFLEKFASAGTPSFTPRHADTEGGDNESHMPDGISDSDWRAPIMPKGLRSFDADDATSFLELLPGPRDRHGLSEAIRFWKTRIEETAAEETFAVGLIYGPSGCGKSSLVKAGLIPRLAPQVVPVYLEATGSNFEARLLERLRRRFPRLSPDLGLAESLATLRRGTDLPRRLKLLLVLDQFEQWLHAHGEGQATELSRALLQCDGSRIQALVMVRDDFWMASSRFMRELEVKVVDGHNAAAVDLFTPSHARRILAAFGRAFGSIPTRHGDLSADQDRFLDRAVDSLAQEGKVIPVRLALFAEMLKGKPWTTETLKRLGGSVGVGVTFLEETFAATTASPENRHHQVAARGVLAALLPGPGADIKGHMRSREELLEASGYARVPDDFENLMRILDSQTRLLTPIAPESHGGDDVPTPPAAEQPRAQYYQLTHDYLVPSIREWLTRKQKETRRGRAELRLEERAGLWNAKPERKQLPSLAEWLEILLFTSGRRWSDAERAMMNVASRQHLVRAGAVAGCFLVIGLLAFRLRDSLAQDREAAHAEGLVQRLLVADTPKVPEIVDEIGKDRSIVDPLLKRALKDTAAFPTQRLHARLALLPSDPSQVDPLFEQLLECDVESFPIIRDALRPARKTLTPRLWNLCQTSNRDPQRQFRAAAALADYDPTSPFWDKQSRTTAEQLAAQPALLVQHWVDALRPIKERLLPPLTDLFRDRSVDREINRSMIAEILVDYAGDHTEFLAELIQDAGPIEFPILLTRLKSTHEKAVAPVQSLLGQRTDQGKDVISIVNAKRAANLAIALFQLGRTDPVWPLLKANPNPQIRSYLIDQFASYSVDCQPLYERLTIEKDDSIRAALIMTLGHFDKSRISPQSEAEMTSLLLRVYEHDPSQAVHGAATWLIQKWGLHEQREQIDGRLATGSSNERRRWYLNRLGQTMVMIPSPAKFQLGSPSNEEGRFVIENVRTCNISHAYDLSAYEVTDAQFQLFLEDHPDLRGRILRLSQTPPNGPITGVTWYDAANFCNWLNQREGIPKEQWCYLPNDKGDYAAGMHLAPDYFKRTGYRLPSEPEWEYACRAGTSTSRYYGDAIELMTRYASFLVNSGDRMFPAGSFLPNEFGLFDMYGNAIEWCQEWRDDTNPPPGGEINDVEDTANALVLDSTRRMVRGGQIFNHVRHLRSARRFADFPNMHNNVGGFRLARSRIQTAQ